MAKIIKISSSEITNALEGNTRQYLVGNLQNPERLQHIPNPLIEIGITRYAEQGGTEATHTHKQAFEFQYVTSGITAYLDTTTSEEHIFRAGDFYMIEYGVVYAQKSGPNTEILFIKVPPGNDKVPVEIAPEVQIWFERSITESARTMARRDYFYDKDAPNPNSIRPATAVAVFDSKGDILLLRRRDNDRWTMPGGTQEFGESLTECAVREVREETGLQIRITGLIGTYSDPHVLIAYTDGEVRQEFTLVYAAEIESGDLRIDAESKEFRWVPLLSMLSLPLADSQKRRLRDVVEFRKEPKTFLR